MRSKIKRLLNKIVKNQRPVYSKAYYLGSGDTSFSGWIPFNTVVENEGGGTWSNGHYIVPKDGYYLINFTCYSNASANGRVALNVMRGGATVNQDDMIMAGNNYTTSVTGIYKCEAGDHLVAGAYNSSYPISIFAAPGHNSFTIVRVPMG